MIFSPRYLQLWWFWLDAARRVIKFWASRDDRSWRRSRIQHIFFWYHVIKTWIAREEHSRVGMTRFINNQKRTNRRLRRPRPGSSKSILNWSSFDTMDAKFLGRTNGVHSLITGRRTLDILSCIFYTLAWSIPAFWSFSPYLVFDS
jgi:hypothetical protein